MLTNGNILMVSDADAHYLLRYMIASKDPEKSKGIQPWQTLICPECGNSPTPDNGPHILDEDGFVLIGCEGYFVINPARIGMHHPNWMDWHEELGGD